MPTTVFEWIIGGLSSVFCAAIIALWTLQLALENRLVAWIKKHIEDDDKKHDEIEEVVKALADAAHAAELKASERFATKIEIEKVFTEVGSVRAHIDQQLGGVNARLDLVLLNMRPGKD